MVEFSPATREARVRLPARQGVENFCPKLSLFLSLCFVVVVVVLFFFFFFSICPHSAHLLAHLFSMNCKQKLFVLNLLVYISVNLLSYQGVFVFFFLAMFCVASPIECASQGLFGS